MTQNPLEAVVEDPNAIKKITLRQEAATYIQDLLRLSEIDLPSLSHFDLQVRVVVVSARLFFLIFFG